MELEAVIGDLEKVRRECSAPNWDGDGAKPVNGESCSLAQRFAELLPKELLPPDVYAAPSGHVYFEWDEGKRKVFTVGFSDKDIFYAGLLGAEKWYGRAEFQEQIPNEILRYIRRFYS